MMIGTIIKALSGFYYVSFENTTYECKARGSFRKSGVSPLVGDRVEFSLQEEDKGTIEKVLERKNCLSRPPVANIDKLFIVSSFSAPAPNTLIIDKMTAIAEYNNIVPIIVFNKSDEGDFKEYRDIYAKSGFKTYVVSAKNGDGMKSLVNEMSGCVSAFTGNSGVGKSSILNFVFGNSDIETGEVSEKLGRGRHTTRHTELYELPFGGFIADTPGFSSLEDYKYSFDFKEKLPFLFSDFSDFLHDCRFTSCSHTKENGCAVIEAVNNGKIEKSRHDSYVSLYNEMKDIKQWNSKK